MDFYNVSPDSDPSVDSEEPIKPLPNPNFNDFQGNGGLKIKLTLERLEEVSEIYDDNFQFEYTIFGREKNLITIENKDKSVMRKASNYSTGGNLYKASKTVEINKSQSHIVKISSQDDFDYINQESLIINVYASEKVNKQGRLSHRNYLPIDNIELVKNCGEVLVNRVRSQTANSDKQQERKRESSKCIIF